MIRPALIFGIGLSAALPTSKMDMPYQRRELLSFSRMFCYVDATGALKNASGSTIFISEGCTAEPQTAPACTVDSTPSSSAPCSLSNLNGVDSDRWESSYTFDHCSKAVKFIRGEGTDCDSPNTSCHHYCHQLDSTGDWASRRRPASSRPETAGTGWWGCGWWSGYQWHGGRCKDKTRYLGEECWDDDGQCFNDGIEPYKGLRMSCATDAEAAIIGKPKCIPSAFKLETQDRCTCNWFDWHVGFACGASQCNGHPCVWNTGDGNRYCDYQSQNNW